MGLLIEVGDNLDALERLRGQGHKFDVVEIDGPYGVGLEHWDDLDAGEYLDHYIERLALVRQVLQPWGLVFFWGYPEGVSEIKHFVEQANLLKLRRWIHWHKQRTCHKGRKVEVVLLLSTSGSDDQDLLARFGEVLREERERRGWTLMDVQERADGPVWWHRGGHLYYETGLSIPSWHDYAILKRLFDLDDSWDCVLGMGHSHEGLTDIDYIGRRYDEETMWMSEGLRSKPVGLYLTLFSPVTWPEQSGPRKRALVLYGGSGNAAVAAASLGYGVTICEMSRVRANRIADQFWTRVEACRSGHKKEGNTFQLAMGLT